MKEAKTDYTIKRLELWTLKLTLMILSGIGALILALYVDMHFELKIATPILATMFFVLVMYYLCLAVNKYNELRGGMENEEE